MTTKVESIQRDEDGVMETWVEGSVNGIALAAFVNEKTGVISTSSDDWNIEQDLAIVPEAGREDIKDAWITAVRQYFKALIA